MRVELRAQRPELGFAREDLHPQLPLLRLPRQLEREQQVVHRQREQEQQHAGGEEQRIVAGVAGRRFGERRREPSAETHRRISSTHKPLAMTAARADDDSTRSTPLEVSGVARQTYQAERHAKP